MKKKRFVVLNPFGVFRTRIRLLDLSLSRAPQRHTTNRALLEMRQRVGHRRSNFPFSVSPKPGVLHLEIVTPKDPATRNCTSSKGSAIPSQALPRRARQ